ncbi:helix-turn-helix domain-containing protein [Bifidobacterium apousia]
MPNTTNLFSALTRLGFSRYEAKAYVALVDQPPMNGSEVSRLTEMPPSKI